MPDPKRYTVRDPESGRTVTFAWSGDAPPTDDDIAEVFAAAPAEPPLTRERGAPQSEAAREQVSPFSALLGEAGETVGRWSSDNLPALASTGAALATGGASLPVTVGAGILAGGAGAAGREGMRRVTGERQPMTGEQLGLDIAKEGATSGALAGVPRMAMGAARAAGPAIANNARKISTAVRGVTGAGPLAGGGAWYATGSPLIGAATAAVSRAATSPTVIRGVGNITARVGNSPMLNTAAERLGLGANAARAGVDAFRKALLDALGAESSASTDR